MQIEQYVDRAKTALQAAVAQHVAEMKSLLAEPPESAEVWQMQRQAILDKAASLTSEIAAAIAKSLRQEP
jgi:hypothetical protein